MDLNKIQQLTKHFADARADLRALVSKIQQQVEAIERENLPRLKDLVGRAAEREAVLRQALESAPELFERPRTVVFHGVQVGYQQGRGRLTIPDPDRTIEKIKNQLDHPEQYLRIVETPDKTALGQLTADMLRRLGCELVETGDMVVIRPVRDDLDKAVSAILKKAVNAAQAKASKN